MNKHHASDQQTDEQQITLRGPAELADALPYMMGFHPTDSIVIVALHGSRGRFGGRVRLGIPRSPREWPPVAQQLAQCLIEGSERRSSRPDGIVVYLCQDPADGETGRRVMERLRPLAQRLRTACGSFDVPVYEALCISDGRFWSYCCPDERCCPPDGKALAIPGTSVMAAAAAYAGVQLRGSLRDMEARLTPRDTASADDQLKALHTAASELVPRILNEAARTQVGDETLALARGLMERIAAAPRTASRSEADAADDRLITQAEAAALILGLQDRQTRDRAAEWMEGPEAEPALRLWRALSRRCVGPYADHATAPLTLAGWVSWSTGDEPFARVALGLALRLDPDYVFARLLHQACNEDLDPETLRNCLRTERTSREATQTAAGRDTPQPSEPSEPSEPSGRTDRGRPRTRRAPGGTRAPRPARPRPGKAGGPRAGAKDRQDTGMER